MFSEFSFPYAAALRQIKLDELSSQHYISGIMYGVFPEILYDFSLRDVERSNTNRGNGELKLDEILANNEIDLVLFSDGDPAKRKSLFVGLKNAGWEKWAEFKSELYKTKIIGLKKKQ